MMRPDRSSRVARLLWSWFRPQAMSLEWLEQHEASSAREEFHGVCWPWPIRVDDAGPVNRAGFERSL